MRRARSRVLLPAAVSWGLLSCGVISGLDDLEVVDPTVPTITGAATSSAAGGGTNGCAPGALGEPCCEGMCSGEGACVDETCVACGEAGAPCCTTGTACGALLACTAGTCLGCAVDIDLGAEHSCARKTDGTLWCWGSNARGELGIGDYDEDTHALPIAVMNLGGGVTGIGAGGENTCALKASSVWCWGYNGEAEVGTGSITPEVITSPVEVTGLGATTLQIAPGETRHGCAIQREGAVCWGSNDAGQLGDGSQDGVFHAPQPVPGMESAERIAVGGNHTCARRFDGSVWCWGKNDLGQLGLGAADGNPHPSPVEVTAIGPDAADLSAHVGHTCVVKSDRSLWCWGPNDCGELGSSAAGPGPLEVTALGKDVAEVAVDDGTTCARKTDGSVWCWGCNGVGQLGVGAADSNLHPDPVQVPIGANVVEIAAGEGHMCARTIHGQITCWGLDNYGQIGDGNGGPTEKAVSPTLVHLECP